MIQSTAASLASQDEAGASAILGGNGAAAGAVGGVISGADVPAPDLPGIPQLPAALDPMPGEARAAALYGGPGAGSLYDFADQWSRYGDELDELAAQTQQTGAAIADQWVDGRHRAATNTVEHGEWAREMGQQARQLAQYARTVGESFETAKANTPSPDEIAHTKQSLQHAIQRFAATKGANAAEVAQWTERYAQQQAQANEAAANYHASVTAASAAAPNGAAAAPAIAGGTGRDTAAQAIAARDPDDWFEGEGPEYVEPGGAEPGEGVMGGIPADLVSFGSGGLPLSPQDGTTQPPLPPLEPPAPPYGDDFTWNPDGSINYPDYPPYVPESQFDTTQGAPRSALDGVHGTRGDEPIYWAPSYPGELPPYWTRDYMQLPGSPNMWVPDTRPSPPGQTNPV